ncbi:hypothetical protein RF11_15722 [Thelohanellus kitauei]|uniref:DDE-1 domain-containing protein n=1 Tax=Thelohanellus kitauei TaxID=669202 RepID=A0A0C2JKK9_THEKT|nr:hypothetical protein RF11_15722 [Thelohanellus kitauei]
MTIPAQIENANEHARQKMLKKRFIVDFPMPEIASCQSVVSANEEGKTSSTSAIPEGTLSFKNSETAACKMAKEGAILLFACIMDWSEKLKPLNIGKSKNPRYFKNVKTLPVDMKLIKIRG